MKIVLTLLLVLLPFAVVGAVEEPAAHSSTSEILLWVIGGLITFINGWSSYTLRQILLDIRELRERLVSLETKHRMHHKDEGDM